MSDFGMVDKFGPERREPAGNITYEQALIRSRQKDVKSPEVQAAIDAALKLGPSGQGSDFKNPTDYGFKYPEPDPNNPFGNIAPSVMLDYIGPNGERVSATAGMIPPPGFTQVGGPGLPESGPPLGPIKEMPMYEMEGGLEKGQGNIVDRPNPNRPFQQNDPAFKEENARIQAAYQNRPVGGPIDQAPNQTPSSRAQSNLDRINQELSDLYAENPPNPGAIENKKRQQQQAAAAAMGEGQKDLVSTAVSRPEELATKTAVAQIDPNTVGTTIAQGTGDAGAAGQATATQTGAAQQATTPTGITPASMQATTTQGAVDTALGSVDAAQGTVSTTVDAATKDPTTVAGTDLDVDQIAEATQVVKPDPRLVQTGELLDGSAVNMAAVQAATDIQAATADPTKQATVKGQLDDLMDDFDGGATPAWAAGAMRAATAAMAARGLGSSSMAGQAIVQAAMESALPIAQQDAQTVAAFEAANLSNRQQTALFAAQQRADFLKLDFNQEFQSRVENAAKISDIANMNFTAEQQIALENARMAQTVDLTNLNSRNAKIMANAAAMANMDMANLSNQQQARVENAKSFLQIDMANLSNAQQVEIFKANSVQQAILSDAAADNAAKQFNASSENQTNQFMADLESRTSQFNASQSNALAQFNVGEVNAIAQFNEEQNNAREEFNTKNALIIAQANAQWRQSTTTTNTAAQNEANMQDAKAMNAFTASTLDQIWQRERDLLSYAWQASESALDRINQVILQNIIATASANNTAATNAASVQAAAVSAEGSKWGAIGAAVLGINWG